MLREGTGESVLIGTTLLKSWGIEFVGFDENREDYTKFTHFDPGYKHELTTKRRSIRAHKA